MTKAETFKEENMEKEFKKVNAQIIGADGNIFNLIGICQRELKRNGYYNEASELAKRVTNSHSYDEALQIIMEYVNPVSEYDEGLNDYDEDYSNIDIQEELHIFKKYHDQYTKKYTEELKNTGIFWAFGREQFEDNKTHKDAPDNEYLSVFSGGYIHKSNSSKLDNFFKNIVPKLKKEFTDNIKIEDLIKYELINHECYYTGDFSDVLDIIKDYYDLPDEEIYQKVKSVYDTTREKTIDDFDDYSNITI